LVARIAIAVAAIPALFAGLAVAGVKLPGPADSAFESVGIELPNQEADGDEQGTAAPAVKGTETGAESTDKGNSAAAHENAREQRKKARGKAVGHTRGKAIGLNELEPPGHSGDTGPPEHSSSGAARSNSAGGKAGSTLPPRSRGRGKGPTK
jgi:hypothetical protein